MMERGNFLKAMLGGTAMALTGEIIAGTPAKPVGEPKQMRCGDAIWWERRWKKDGVSFVEYTLPLHVLPVFDKVKFAPLEEGKVNPKRVLIPVMDLDSPDLTETVDELVSRTFEAYDADPFKSGKAPYCVVVKVKDHPSYFGVGVLDWEVRPVTNAYRHLIK